MATPHSTTFILISQKVPKLSIEFGFKFHESLVFSTPKKSISTIPFVWDVSGNYMVPSKGQFNQRFG